MIRILSSVNDRKLSSCEKIILYMNREHIHFT